MLWLYHGRLDDGDTLAVGADGGGEPGLEIPHPLAPSPKWRGGDGTSGAVGDDGRGGIGGACLTVCVAARFAAEELKLVGKLHRKTSKVLKPSGSDYIRTLVLFQG
jgi:hypothetical protein